MIKRKMNTETETPEGQRMVTGVLLGGEWDAPDPVPREAVLSCARFLNAIARERYALIRQVSPLTNATPTGRAQATPEEN